MTTTIGFGGLFSRKPKGTEKPQIIAPQKAPEALEPEIADIIQLPKPPSASRNAKKLSKLKQAKKFAKKFFSKRITIAVLSALAGAGLGSHCSQGAAQWRSVKKLINVCEERAGSGITIKRNSIGEINKKCTLQY